MIGLLIIQEYNFKINSSDVFFVENIFILFMLPGYDMFRVFLFRTLNKKIHLLEVETICTTI